jgi:hypothetical protein
METLVSVDSSNLVSGSTTTEVAVAEAEAATLLSVADVEGEEVAAEENGWAGDSLPDGAFFLEQWIMIWTWESRTSEDKLCNQKVFEQIMFASIKSSHMAFKCSVFSSKRISRTRGL